MSDTKFTKGKWEAIEHNWSDASVYGGGKRIALLSIYDEATEDSQEELEIEKMANAHLIRLAPEMYLMIEKIADLIKDQPNEIALADEVCALSYDLRDLIAKARGESC